jgi:8-oxo-dGTP pyrophosphatase MutT (NUDIX family)
MTRFVVAACVVIVREGRMLAMRRAAHRDAGAGLWEAVSGRVDDGEQPEQAAVREVREESGLAVELDPRPVTAYRARRGAEPMVVIVYRARWTSGEVVRSDEHDDHAWLTPDEFAERCSLTLLVGAVRAACQPEAGNATESDGETGGAP